MLGKTISIFLLIFFEFLISGPIFLKIKHPKSDEFFIPILSFIDTDVEKAKLEEELKYLQGFLASVEKKLSNQKFVEGAPAKVVEMEQKKKADTVSKIKAIEASLSSI